MVIRCQVAISPLQNGWSSAARSLGRSHPWRWPSAGCITTAPARIPCWLIPIVWTISGSPLVATTINAKWTTSSATGGLHQRGYSVPSDKAWTKRERGGSHIPAEVCDFGRAAVDWYATIRTSQGT
jgi:hypothetical protein